MNELRIKNQEKVLKTLISMQNASETHYIYHPVGFEANFPFVSVKALIDILEILSDKNYIIAEYADLPDNFNIHMLQVTPAGLNYHPQKALETKQRWLERLYGFVVGVILGSVITYFMPIILDRIFGR